MPRSPILSIFALAMAVSLAACTQAPAPPPDTSAQDTTAINALRDTWAATYARGDAAALANLYTADATVMQPGTATLSGRPAIQAYYATFFQGGTVQTSLTQTSLTLHGDTAHSTGTFSGTMTPAAGGEPQKSTGRYLVILKRDTDGAWRLSKAMSNTDDPAMMKAMAESMMMRAQGGAAPTPR
jgi:uncharacterized protein (TIGR02246 family)